MAFLKFPKSTDTPKRSKQPSGSGSTSRYADVRRSSTHSSQPHPRIVVNQQPQSYNAYTYNQTGGRSYSDYQPPSHRATSSHGLCGNYRQRMDVSPVREATHSHVSSSMPGDRPVSPLGTSRFEQPSPWANRRVTSCRPRTSAMRDEHGFSIRNPHSQHAQGIAFGMSTYAPVSTDEYEYFESRGRHRGYSEATAGQSGRGDAYGASRGSKQTYNMQSDFRNGGFSDWMNY